MNKIEFDLIYSIFPTTNKSVFEFIQNGIDLWGDTIFLSFKVTKEKLGYVIIADEMIQVDISGGTLYNRVPTDLSRL